jgi:NitT/TauT family transport system substrate-binding protein
VSLPILHEPHHDSGAGYVASYYSTFLPDGQPRSSRRERDWIEKNRRRPRSAVRGGSAAFMASRQRRVRAAIGKYIKLPPEVIAKAQIAPPGPIVTPKQLSYWVDLMKDQEMLKTTPDVTRLIAR